MSHRKEFLHYFFKGASDFRYALLKFTHEFIDEIPTSSDIDLLIKESEKIKFLKLIRAGDNIEWVHVYKKSFVTFVNISFKDGTYLEVDLIHRFDRKGIIYLEAKDILNHVIISKENIKVAALKHNYEYIVLFNLINKANTPDRYVQYYTSLSKEERSEIFGYICHKYKLHLNTLDELFVTSERESKKIIQKILEHSDNHKVFRAIKFLRYITDVFRDMIHNRGIVVTFSGVDGAGKSTLLESVRDSLQIKYRQRVKVLRHRPSLLPILSSIRYGKRSAEMRTINQLPRQGSNTNKLSSLIRFLYYYLDYLFGQYYIYFKYTLRGYTVLYDRYYFDFIIDSKRSNIVLPKSFLRLFYYFLFKPNVNVFLYAAPEIILSRKRELSSIDIQNLTAEYKELFEDLSKSGSKQQYMVINNTDLNHTLDLVMKECISATL